MNYSRQYLKKKIELCTGPQISTKVLYAMHIYLKIEQTRTKFISNLINYYFINAMTSALNDKSGYTFINHSTRSNFSNIVFNRIFPFIKRATDMNGRRRRHIRYIPYQFNALFRFVYICVFVFTFWLQIIYRNGANYPANK